MSKIVPSSKLVLYQDVDITSGEQIAFPSKSVQDAYFNAHAYSNDLTFTYIRRTGSIKVKMPVSQVAECNYLSFINPAFENKKFYAKIVNYEYVNNVTTLIMYAIDWFQTYMFDVIYEFGMIEREHISVADDSKNPITQGEDVLEYQTAEDLPVSKEFEDIYTSVSTGSFGSIESSGDVLLYPPLGSVTDAVNIAQISNFDTTELDPSEFESEFDEIISSGPVISWGYKLYVTDSDTKLQNALDWLTYHNLSRQVIGIYQIPSQTFNSYKSVIAGMYNLSEVGINHRQYDVVNNKLLMYPYQYLRVENNEGDAKEYRYEWFKASGDHGHGVAQFEYIPCFDGSPSISMVPIRYKSNSAGTNATIGGFGNIAERIDCNMIPQVGYTTDAYLSFLGAQYAANVSQRKNTLGETMAKGVYNYAAPTEDNPTSLLGLKNIIASAGGTVLSGAANVGANMAMGNTGGAVASGVGALGGLGSASPYSVSDESRAWESGGNIVDSKMFSPAKGAYVADDYHAGSGNGLINAYVNKRLAGSFTFTRVKLKDVILQTYDNYLSGYGYKSGRVGKPRVCNWIEGSTDESEIPVFRYYNGHYVTYIKTSNMHVTHTLKEVSDNIENMFNTGVQLLDGSSL